MLGDVQGWCEALPVMLNVICAICGQKQNRILTKAIGLLHHAEWPHCNSILVRPSQEGRW